MLLQDCPQQAALLLYHLLLHRVLLAVLGHVPLQVKILLLSLLLPPLFLLALLAAILFHVLLDRLLLEAQEIALEGVVLALLLRQWRITSK